MNRGLVVVLLLAACGHKDECEILIDRAAEMGQPSPNVREKDLADCRAHIDLIHDNPVEMCVIAASTTQKPWVASWPRCSRSATERSPGREQRTLA